VWWCVYIYLVGLVEVIMDDGVVRIVGEGYKYQLGRFRVLSGYVLRNQNSFRDIKIGWRN